MKTPLPPWTDSQEEQVKQMSIQSKGGMPVADPFRGGSFQHFCIVPFTVNMS